MGYGFGPPPGYGTKKGKSQKEAKPAKGAPKKAAPAKGTPKKNVKRRKSLVKLMDAQMAGSEMATQERIKTKQFLGYPGFYGPGYGYGGFVPGFGYAPGFGYPGFGYPGYGYPGFGYPGFIDQNKK